MKYKVNVTFRPHRITTVFWRDVPFPIAQVSQNTSAYTVWLDAWVMEKTLGILCKKTRFDSQVGLISVPPLLTVNQHCFTSLFRTIVVSGHKPIIRPLVQLFSQSASIDALWLTSSLLALVWRNRIRINSHCLKGNFVSVILSGRRSRLFRSDRIFRPKLSYHCQCKVVFSLGLPPNKPNARDVQSLVLGWGSVPSLITCISTLARTPLIW